MTRSITPARPAPEVNVHTAARPAGRHRRQPRFSRGEIRAITLMCLTTAVAAIWAALHGSGLDWLRHSLAGLVALVWGPYTVWGIERLWRRDVEAAEAAGRTAGYRDGYPDGFVDCLTIKSS